MKLELLLKGKDQLSAILKKQSPLLKQLDKDALKAYNTLKKLFNLKPKSIFGDFSKGIKGEGDKIVAEVAKIKKAFNSINNLKIKTPKISSPSFSPSPSRKPNQKNGSEELNELFDKKRNPKRKPKGYVEQLANFNERYFEPVGQVKDVWKGQIDSLKQYTDEATKLLRLQGRFRQINLPEAENQKVFAAVRENVKNIRGISLADSQELFTDIYNALGNVDSAIAALPMASKYKVASSALYGDIYTPEEIKSQIQKGFKMLELTGATKDRATMEARFDTITKIANSTGGEVTLAKLLALTKQAAPAVQTLDERGIRNITSVVDEMGGDRTGTALSALYRAWVGGIMKQPVAQRYQELGLVKEGGIEYNKSGILKSIKPGANILGDLMMKDPLAAVDRLTEAIKADAAKKGIDVSTPEGMNKQLRGLMGTETSFRLANALINNRAQVEKESERAKNAKGAVGSYNSLNNGNSPLLKIEEYEAAITNFKANSVLPLIQVLGKLADTATPILKFFGEHEDVAKWTMYAILAGKAITGISQTASVLNNSGNSLISFFNRGKSSADSATQSFRNASTELGGVNSRMSGFKNAVGITLRVGAIVGLEIAIQKTVESYMAATEAKKGAQDSISRNTAAFNRTINDPDISADDKAKIIKLQSADVFGKLNADNDLLQRLGLQKAQGWEKWTDSFKGSWFIPGVKNEGYGQKQSLGLEDAVLPYFTLPMKFMQSQFGKNYSIETAAQKFRDDAPTLKQPEVMREFLKYLPERIKGNDAQSVSARNEIGKIAQTAFPDTYKQAMLQMSLEQARLSEQSGQLGQSFLNLQNPMPTLIEQLGGLNTKSNLAVTGVDSLATATNNAASRINAVEFKAPTYSLGNITGVNPNPAPKPNPLFGGLFGGGRSNGGSVTKGHSYRINEVGQEMFTPASSGSIVSNSELRNAGSRRNASASSPTINFNPTINLYSDNPNEAMEAIKVLRRELAILKSELKEDFSPDRMAQKVEFAAQRDSERT